MVRDLCNPEVMSTRSLSPCPLASGRLWVLELSARGTWCPLKDMRPLNTREGRIGTGKGPYQLVWNKH